MNYYNESGYMFYDNDTVDFTARGHHIDRLLGDRAEHIIRSQTTAAASPFFLYLAPQSPHFPQLYEDYTRPQMLDALRDLDTVVGRVVAALKQTGLYDNTVIAFTSDNGGDPNYGGNNLPLRGQKETLWEGGLRVPAFVHSPLLAAARAGTVSRQLFHITDWMPTLLRAAGMSSAEIERQGWDGIDQWKSFRRSGYGSQVDGVGMKPWRNLESNALSSLHLFLRNRLVSVCGEVKGVGFPTSHYPVRDN
jgi:arylsulfatase I/J